MDKQNSTTCNKIKQIIAIICLCISSFLFYAVIMVFFVALIRSKTVSLNLIWVLLIFLCIGVFFDVCSIFIDRKSKYKKVLGIQLSILSISLIVLILLNKDLYHNNILKSSLVFSILLLVLGIILIVYKNSPDLTTNIASCENSKLKKHEKYLKIFSIIMIIFNILGIVGNLISITKFKNINLVLPYILVNIISIVLFLNIIKLKKLCVYGFVIVSIVTFIINIMNGYTLLFSLAAFISLIILLLLVYPIWNYLK